MEQQIQALYTRFYGQNPVSVETINGSASNRLYLRLYASDGSSVVGVGCPDLLEMRAFCELDKSLADQGIRVPKVLVQEGACYLQEDLGKTSLYDLIASCQKEGAWSTEVVGLLEQIMRDLVEIQFKGLQGFDLSHCCGQQHFSEVNIRWDLNYFKYCFLKGTGVAIDELKLQADLDRLEKDLLDACADLKSQPTFLYRDFQSRNVMVSDGKPYYIDFQGGYEGPFFYDVASFLWQSRADYPIELRNHLIDVYCQSLQKYVAMPASEFRTRLDRFAFFRMLQVLGAYGFRGIFERKAAFLSPIAKTLTMIRESGADYAYIRELISSVWNTPLGRSLFGNEADMNATHTSSLTVRITSFSYKKGIPDDFSGNGGGFVFDCRAPHNPGRYKEYKQITGLDQPVIDFLEGRDLNPDHQPIGSELTMPQYLEHVYALVDPAVDNYRIRGFTNLMVSFGCTGGQHRSVYGAQHLAEHLHSLYPDVHIILTHREQGIVQEF